MLLMISLYFFIISIFFSKVRSRSALVLPKTSQALKIERRKAICFGRLSRLGPRRAVLKALNLMFMYIICILFAYYMYIICILYVYILCSVMFGYVRLCSVMFGYVPEPRFWAGSALNANLLWRLAFF